MSERWFVNNKFQADQFCEYIRANQDKGHIYEIIPCRGLISRCLTGR